MTDDDLRQIPIILTTHAIDRIKERFHLSKKVAVSLITKALAFGDIRYQKRVRGESQSISILHHGRLFKLVIKVDHLCCTTAHNFKDIIPPPDIMSKGKKLKLCTGLTMKVPATSKRSKFRPKSKH